jgi:hypothetical protein
MGELRSLGLEERVALLEAEVRRLDRALTSGSPRSPRWRLRRMTRSRSAPHAGRWWMEEPGIGSAGSVESRRGEGSNCPPISGT